MLEGQSADGSSPVTTGKPGTGQRELTRPLQVARALSLRLFGAHWALDVWAIESEWVTEQLSRTVPIFDGL